MTYRLLLKACSAMAAAAFITAAAFASSPSVHPVAAPPSLHPLPMSLGGRMLVSSSAANKDFGGRTYTWQWPGIYFRTEFAGTRVFFRIIDGDQILHLRADGQQVATLVKPHPGVYELDGLTQGTHRIGLYVATESQAGPNTFGGFALPPGEKALRLPRRHRQIEFIGDSHTVGYGDLSTTRACSRDKVWRDTDDTRAFGPIIARHFHADYQVNAISGRGVVRNYNGFKADTLPQAYPWILFDKKQKYSDPAWHPQVLVVALGTNDFSTALNPGEPWKTRAQLHADFESTYLRFLESLRNRNPHALIVVWATGMAHGEIEAEARKVVGRMQQHGDRHIVFIPIDELAFTACDSHPSLADEKVISSRLEAAIDAHPRVWQRR